MSNNDKFRRSLKAGIDKAKSKTPLFFIRFMLEVDRRVIMKSPVDTGRFRGNWMIGNGTINTGTNDAVAGGTFGTYTPYNKEVIKALKINGQTIYLTNSLDYARTLEYGLYGTGKYATVKTTRDGYSIQAPYGFVRVTLAEMGPLARQVATEIKPL